MNADGPSVGIVDPDEAVVGVPSPGELADAVVDAGGIPVELSAERPAEHEVAFLVVPGEATLRTVVGGTPSVPLLPVAVDDGVASVPSEALEAAISAAIDGDPPVREHPVVSVRLGDGRRRRALRDAALMTAEPARISEFGIEAGVGRVAVVRADGIVVATPAGSHGYNAAAAGPLLAPDTGLAVVPIAPFVTDRDRWVLPEGRIEIAIRRNETPIAVHADGCEIGQVEGGATVTFLPDGTLSVLETPASRSPFEG